MKLRLLLCMATLCATASAQTTWIVNAGGGPGVDFPDLPAAVAAAASGDTIIVQMGPFGQGADPFTTAKGLTIIGEGGQVPFTTSGSDPFVVHNLPPGSAFRMVGFSRPSNGALDFRITDCLGQVHLERMEVREQGAFFPTGPSIEIEGSTSVTLRGVTNFGSPAVEVTGSTLSLVGCELGVTKIGAGGGPALTGTLAVIHIVEPQFDTGFGAPASITTTNCQLTITGDSAASISNFGGDVISAQGGQVEFDPSVTLAAGPGFQPIVGSASVTSTFLPASWTGNANPGQPLTVTTWAPPGASVFLAIGAPGPLTATVIGTLGIDPSKWFAFLPVVVSPPSGVTTTGLPIPATFPLGSAIATQALVVTPTQVLLGQPCTFVVH